MLPADQRDVIARFSLFEGLTESEFDRVIVAGRTYDVAQGEFYFLQGQESTMLYVIVGGRVKLSQVTADGQQVIVAYFGPGEGLGIVMALNQQPYPLSAEAIEPSTAVGWRREAMLGLMQDNAQLALNGMRMVGQRFGQMQSRFQELATQRVEQRVARALLRLVRQFGRRVDEGVLVDIAISREELAQMTGTNLYNVSRILSKWEHAGWIVTSRRQVILKMSHELVALAEDLPPAGIRD